MDTQVVPIFEARDRGVAAFWQYAHMIESVSITTPMYVVPAPDGNMVLPVMRMFLPLTTGTGKEPNGETEVRLVTERMPVVVPGVPEDVAAYMIPPGDTVMPRRLDVFVSERAATLDAP